MRYEIRGDSVLITGYVNAVERLSKPIREELNGRTITFLERIKSGVFRTALERNDNVLVLLNHDNNRVLATTKDSTAILEEDNIGLRAEITITDKEVVQKAREGKLSGWSFGFVCKSDEITTEGNNTIRTVTDIELQEISILDDTKSPAYYGTSIETREGGAEMEVNTRVETRVDELTEETPKSVAETQQIDFDALAEAVAEKVAAMVIEALKTEEKAEETEETDTETQTEETEETQETETQTEEVEQNEENRSIDYSDFEQRLSKLRK